MRKRIPVYKCPVYIGESKCGKPTVNPEAGLPACLECHIWIDALTATLKQPPRKRGRECATA